MSASPADSPILGTLFGTDEMRAVFSDRQWLQCMLDVEAALARAQAGLGIVPADAARAISAAAHVEKVDFSGMAESTRRVGYPVIGLTKALGAASGKEAARWVHWGATTQDILDTAAVLQARRGLDLVERDLRALIRALAERAAAHRSAVMPGRTHLQHALPITFGYKCAVWLAPLLDHIERLAQLRARCLVLQFGGAVGTLASLGGRGREAVEALAQELGLAAPESPWHANRERFVEMAGFLALLCGTLGKMAADVILLMQTEIGEVFEPHEAGRGGSSTMPQKRNPIASEYVIAAARAVHALVPVMLGATIGDHERATGPWQSEQLALPQIFVLSAGALAHSVSLAEGMTVDAARMHRNLDTTQGLVMAEGAMMALAEKTGRGEAHHIIERACGRALEKGGKLMEELAADPAVTAHLDRGAIARALAPENYLGEAEAVVDRVVARARAL